MTTASISLNLERKESLSRQIAQHIRAMIVDGKWAPGKQLPATLALAAMWKTAPHTVHRALIALETEGLVSRRHGKGTFVQKRAKRLACVGIYFREDVLTNHASDFQRTIYKLVKEDLSRQGIRTQAWIDPRPVEEQTMPWPELCRATERREIQGLIVPSIGVQVGWLNKLPVPSAFHTVLPIRNRVETELRQLAELSLQALAEQGCRSVGLIMPICVTEGVEPAGAENYMMDFFAAFTDRAGDLGLRLKDEWMRLPRKVLNMRDGHSQEQYGYKEFLKLWEQPKRPEGLVVFPDTTARGVILGLIEKRVCVPAELKLALHKNETTRLLCPMPATFLMHSERAVARGLIEQVQRQFRGEICEPIKVGFTLADNQPEGMVARAGSSERLACSKRLNLSINSSVARRSKR